MVESWPTQGRPKTSAGSTQTAKGGHRPRAAKANSIRSTQTDPCPTQHSGPSPLGPAEDTLTNLASTKDEPSPECPHNGPGLLSGQAHQECGPVRDAEPHEEPEPREPDDRSNKGLRSSRPRVKGSAFGACSQAVLREACFPKTAGIGGKRSAPQLELER